MKPVRLLLAALCFSALLVIPPETLFAQGRHSERAAIGNFDLRESQSAEFSARKAPAGAAAALKGQLPAVRVERHPVRGAAKFIGSPRSFPAGPKGAGVAAGAAVGALPESDGLLGRHRGLILREVAGILRALLPGATIPCTFRGTRWGVAATRHPAVAACLLAVAVHLSAVEAHLLAVAASPLAVAARLPAVAACLLAVAA